MADTSETVVSSSVKKTVTTQSSTEVWLIGQQIKSLDLEHFRQLPTNGQVLRCLFYDLKTTKLSLSSSYSNVADEVLLLYHAANIPTTQKPNVVTQLKKTVPVLARIRQDRQKELEAEFIQLMATLFDIAHAESEKLIRIPEDRQFCHTSVKQGR